jgi:hypothetical protein
LLLLLLLLLVLVLVLQACRYYLNAMQLPLLQHTLLLV